MTQTGRPLINQGAIISLSRPQGTAPSNTRMEVLESMTGLNDQRIVTMLPDGTQAGFTVRDEDVADLVIHYLDGELDNA